MLVPGLPPATALATNGATINSAVFTGGNGTVVSGGTLYAKSGGAVTLTVNTSSNTECVEVTGALAGHQQNAAGQTSWVFGYTAGAGDGAQTVTVTANSNFNNNKCNGNEAVTTASFTLDNTGPAVTGNVSPSPNAAGWDNSVVTINWAATDAGSGVASGPTPATASQSADTAGKSFSSTAADRRGNTGSGSVSVKLDRTLPTITGSRAPAPNANGWNNTSVTVSFTCSDALSGVKSCSGPTTLSSQGANQTAPGWVTALNDFTRRLRDAEITQHQNNLKQLELDRQEVQGELNALRTAAASQ